MPNKILKFSLTGGQELIRVLREKPTRVVQVLTTKLNAMLHQLSAYIVSQKLSGQALKRRTGTLAGSVRIVPATVKDGTIRGFIESSSGPSFYGNFHEYGVNKSWAIVATKQRALKFLVDGKYRFAKSVQHSPLDARPFMAPSLSENQEHIAAELQRALDEVVSED